MNLTKHVVTKVLSEPIEHRFNNLKESIWIVPVEAESWGTTSQNTLIFKTKEEADKVEIDYEFDA